MKKVFFIFLFVFMLVGCQQSSEAILSELLADINLPNEISEDIDLPNEYTYKSKKVTAVWESSNPEILSPDGKVFKNLTNEKIELTLTLSINEKKQSKNFEITILSMNELERIAFVTEKIEIIAQTKSNISLPTFMDGVFITWTSLNPQVISNIGSVGEVEKQTEVTLTAKFSYKTVTQTKNYSITVLPLSTEEKLNKVLSDIKIPKGILYSDLNLPTQLAYGVSAIWESSNIESLTNQGKVTLSNEQQKVTLKLTINLKGETMTKKFNFTVGKMINFNGHSYVEHTNDFDTNNFNNVYVSDKKLVLKDGALEGSYESHIILVSDFTSLVGSWSALSGANHTVELLIRARINDEWTDYLSYNQWGLGLQNKATNQTSKNNLAKLSYDEFIINNNTANAVQFKVILRRNSATNPTPKLSLVSLALEIPNYSYNIDYELPNLVDHEVPKLNQNIVPVIGNSICSPTSITMLLKFKGHSFSEFDEYEHRYIAKIARDYGNNIYGNWVYNTVTAGAFGEDAYVKRMYSFKELQHHLATVGPVAASVKGDMQGKYTTNGHLIVVRGYRVTPEKTFVITNDPNLKDVYFEYDLDVFMNVWRNIIYVIE